MVPLFVMGRQIYLIIGVHNLYGIFIIIIFRKLTRGSIFMPTLLWRTKNSQHTEAVPICALRKKQTFGAQNSDNLLVHGDNLRALSALMPHYAGTVKCVYIDPPFNTGTDFEGYDDNLKHSEWLTMIQPRIKAIHNILSEDGSLWVSIDSREDAYLKVLTDEIFGRKNFINKITNTTSKPSGFRATASNLFATANYIYVYAKNKEKFTMAKTYIERDYDKSYSKYLHNRQANFSEWQWSNLADVVAQKLEFQSPREAKNQLGDTFIDEIGKFAIANAENVFQTAALSGGAKQKRQETITQSESARGRVFVHPGDEENNFYILNGRQMIFYNNVLIKINDKKIPGQILTNVWTDINWTGIATEGGVKLKNGKKPERLIERVLNMATQPGDLVMDCFLGSGTTAAVAHKMRRRWIGIESRQAQIKNMCIKRLQAVIQGDDPTGITAAAQWQGGGGFCVLEVGKEVFSDSGDINTDVDFMTLAAYLWFFSTHEPFTAKQKSPFLGEHKGLGYALLYNGIIGDKSVDGGNIITTHTLSLIRRTAPKNFDGKIIIYANGCRFREDRRQKENIEFRQIPYECKK